MAFSVVCPVHNEEKMLNCTIRSIYELHPAQVLFGVDRCSDGTQVIINTAAQRYPETETVCVRYTEHDGSDWRFRGAYLRRDLYQLSRLDTIVNTSADLNLAPEIAEIVKMIPAKYRLISFGYLDCWTLETFINRIQQLTRGGFGGLLALSRSAWLECEDLEDLKNTPQGEDDHLHLAVSSRYPTRNIVTRSLHLRPNASRKDAYLSGVDFWKQRHAPLLRMLVRSILHVKPETFVGYMHARRAEKTMDLNEFAYTAKKLIKGD